MNVAGRAVFSPGAGIAPKLHLVLFLPLVFCALDFREGFPRIGLGKRPQLARALAVRVLAIKLELVIVRLLRGFIGHNLLPSL
jgi:hypothetical protein